MNISDALNSLGQASPFELYRLRAAIDRVLDDPRLLVAIRSRLHIGQSLEYFEYQINGLRPCVVLELRRKQVLVEDKLDGKRWLIAYPALNLDGVDVQIREQAVRGLGRNEVAVGELIGFVDKEQRQRVGRILRLNDKTVTVLCDKQRWRVAYVFLHRVVDAEGNLRAPLEIDFQADAVESDAHELDAPSSGA